MPSVTKRPRRSQAERREATRAALLDATIDMLIKNGYANLTTESIVRQAGVTRGAHAHYFTSKADLLVQALDRLLEKLAAEAERTLTPIEGTSFDDYEMLVDRLWELHRGPLLTAALELHVAARTDKELRQHLRRFDRELSARMIMSGIRYVPELVVRPHFEAMFNAAMAAMRGVAVIGFTSPAALERTWPEVRAELVRMGRAEFDGSQAGVASP